jgi:predicted MPP superfamily phosphohydrolase
MKRRTFLRGIAGAGAGLAVGGVSVGLQERLRVGITRAALPVRDLPPAFAGFKIALLTDLHRSTLVSADLIDHAVSLALAERPDAVVLGGDFITNFDVRFAGSAADVLGRLSAPAGVIGVLGNHDDEHAVPSALANRRIRVLREERVRLTRGGDSIDLVGISYWTRGAARIGALIDRAALPILIAHDPRRFAEAQELSVPLVLSGHTHGGQIVIPPIGPINRFRFPITEGTLSTGGTTLFVSRGIGTIYLPLRINCPPEVAILTLTT